MRVAKGPALVRAAACAAATALAACQLLVDVDGLSGGTVAADAAADARDEALVPDGGADAQQDVSWDRDVTCPPSAESVPVLAKQHAFCIDATEVTNDAYALFLASAPMQEVIGAQPAACAWNQSFTPTQGWPPPEGTQTVPVVWVDWCDARAYCSWAGKRLCGAAGGGPLPPPFVGMVDVDQWYQACSAAGTRAFPYGAYYEPGTCNVALSPLAPHFVGNHLACEGGVTGLLDMSGNVWEWTDSCFSAGGDVGPDDACMARGGAFDSVPPHEVACGFASRTSQRSASWGNLGFRCCLDVP